MSRTLVQKGDTVTIVAAAPVKSGDVVVLGALLGVAHFDADTGAEVEIALVGVHSLPKAAVQLIQGARAYWNVAGKQVVAAPATGVCPLGVVTQTAGSSAATCLVRLDGVATAVA